MERIARHRLVGMVLKPVLQPLKKVHRRYKRLKDKRAYHAWAMRNEQLCFVEKDVNQTEKISIVVPTFNTDYQHLMAMVYSVVNQHYQNWELILVNGSSDEDIKATIAGLPSIDTRIVVVDPGKNLGISANTNFGIEHASGSFIAFVDHDDTLHPCALHTLVAAQKDQSADIVYSDEDKMNHVGTDYYDPHCKPDWSPQLFENVNYINHLTMIAVDHVKKAKGLRTDRDGAQDYDLLLRIIDSGELTISHVPHVLYHWRAAESSTANDISTKPYIFKAGQSALQAHFDRTGVDVSVKVIKNKPGFYRPTYEPVTFDIIISPPNRSNRPATAVWLMKLLANSDYHAIVGEWCKKYILDDKLNISFVPDDEESDFLVTAAKKVKYDVAIIFRSAALPREPSMLAEIAAVSHATGHIVQPLLVSTKGIIEDAGLVGASYGLQPLFTGYYCGENTFFGNTDWVRNIEATNGLVMAVPKSQLECCDKPVVSGLKGQGVVLWAHAIFEFCYVLQPNQHIPGFNPSLTQAKSDIHMMSAGWPKNEERANE